MTRRKNNNNRIHLQTLINRGQELFISSIIEKKSWSGKKKKKKLRTNYYAIIGAHKAILTAPEFEEFYDQWMYEQDTYKTTAQGGNEISYKFVTPIKITVEGKIGKNSSKRIRANSRTDTPKPTKPKFNVDADNNIDRSVVIKPQSLFTK